MDKLDPTKRDAKWKVRRHDYAVGMALLLTMMTMLIRVGVGDTGRDEEWRETLRPQVQGGREDCSQVDDVRHTHRWSGSIEQTHSLTHSLKLFFRPFHEDCKHCKNSRPALFPRRLRVTH